jgi:hypothetical protein
MQWLHGAPDFACYTVDAHFPNTQNVAGDAEAAQLMDWP